MASQIEEQIADVENQKSTLLKSIPKDYEAKIIGLEEDLVKLNSTLQEKQDTVQELIKDITGIKAAFTSAKESAKKKKEYKAKLDQVDKEISDAVYVSYMFGKNGIPSIELENSYHTIEEEANLVLSRLGAPFTLEFQSQKPTDKWEANCLACGHTYDKGTRKHVCPECSTPRDKRKKDELSINVLENGQEKQFYMDSGGGKVLLSVAIRVALTRIAQRNTGTTWGTLFLDEVFGQLDEVNRMNMANLITQTLLNELGFEQVFLISHDRKIQSSMADTLIINKKETHSEAQWAHTLYQ